MVHLHYAVARPGPGPAAAPFSQILRLLKDFVATRVQHGTGMANKETFVKADAKVTATPSINGNMIDLGTGYVIAIYERNGVCWVAEFYDGRGEFDDAGAWFRFYAGRLRAARVALKSPTPLTPEMLEKIERLHRESEAREERILAVPRMVAAAAQRWAISLMSQLRGRESKIGQTPASLS
jgi:hypothetical protein